MTRIRSTVVLWFLISAVAAIPRFARADTEIVLQNKFIDDYKDRATIDINYVIDKVPRDVNKPEKDGDIHAAGRADEVKLAMVAEIMNAASVNDAVALEHQLEGSSHQVPLTGAWRIWCEHGGDSQHVQGEPLQKFPTTNPDHVFEVHPITKLQDIDLLKTLHPIEGYRTKDAQRAFQTYESLPCEITPGDSDTTIVTRMAGYNYVEFKARLKFGDKDNKQVQDGRLQMAEICDLEGESLVRKVRLVFIKGSEAEQKTQDSEGKLVHLLGIPRIDLALVSWRLDAATKGKKEVLTWRLPYEIIVVGFYDAVNDDEAEEGRAREAAATRSHRGALIPRDVAPDPSRRRLFNHE